MPRAKPFTAYTPDSQPLVHPLKAHASPWLARGDRTNISSVRFSAREVEDMEVTRVMLSDIRGKDVALGTLIREALAHYCGLCDTAGPADPHAPTRASRTYATPNVLIPTRAKSAMTLRANGSGRGLNVWLSDTLASVCDYLRAHPDCLSWRAFTNAVPDTSVALVGNRNLVRMTEPDLALYLKACELSGADPALAHASAVAIASSLRLPDFMRGAE